MVWTEQIDHMGEMPEIDEVDEVSRHMGRQTDKQAQIGRCVHASINICMNPYNFAYVFASTIASM